MQRREQEAESRRRLRRGVGASLLLHLIVLGGAGSWLLRDDGGRPAEAGSAAMPLAARLAALPVAPAARAVPAVGVPPVTSRPAVHENRRVTPPAAATPAAEPAPLLTAGGTPVRPAAEAGARPAGAEERPVTQAATLSASGAATSAGGTPVAAVSPSPGGGGLDADALRGYRMALALQARRLKRYPPQAMAAGWQGTAEVRIAVGPGGRAQVTELARSSGHELLDRAALGMIESAVQRAVVPAALQAHAFAVVLPVVFSLEER